MGQNNLLGTPKPSIRFPESGPTGIGLMMGPGLSGAILGVKMRGVVIFKKHLDNNPIKSGNFRHTLPLALDLEIVLQAFGWSFEGRVNRGKDQFGHSKLIHLKHLS